jgi:hypothetical protein
VILSLGCSDEPVDVIAAKAMTQAHRPRFGAVWLAGCGRQKLVETDAQCGIDDLLQRLVQLGCGPFHARCDSGIKRGSHKGIMMLRAD